VQIVISVFILYAQKSHGTYVRIHAFIGNTYELEKHWETHELKQNWESKFSFLHYANTHMHTGRVEYS